MKRNRLVQLFFAVLLLTVMVLPVHADTGPKPSVVIELQGLDGRECWATLLSETWSTGPHSSLYRYDEDGFPVQNGSITPDYHPGDPEYPIWQAFADYATDTSVSQGLYFLQYFGQVTEEEPFRWGYYPPDRFKILLYFPETDTLVVSHDFYEQYAFDSYFMADLSQAQMVPGGVFVGLDAQVSYDYTGEPLALLFRVVLTVAIELLVAKLLFNLWEKRQRRLILEVNIVTQLLLNLGLNLYVYYNGPVSLLLYALFELAVLAVECGVYHRKLLEKPQFSLVSSYALVANLASFALGWALEHMLPGMF